MARPQRQDDERVTRPETRISCVLAPNPSPLTGEGTNTYLLGDDALALIDPGPDDPAHIDRLITLIAGRPVSHIIVTHPHLDHSAAAPRLSDLLQAPVLAFGMARDGRSPTMERLAAAWPDTGGEGLDQGFRPDIRLADGDLVFGTGWTLAALHTPGHLGSHLCLACEDVLFSGDHVMGWATSVVSPPDGDMTAYMLALHRLDRPDWRRFLPGHGAPIDRPRDRVAELIRHRQQREAQILDALRLGPATAEHLAPRVYPGLSPALLPAARRNILAHLLDLHGKSQVTTFGAPQPDSPFHLA